MMDKDIYDAYFHHLLEGNVTGCSGIVRDLLEGDTYIRDIYVDLFQSALYEIGTMWEKNEISVATEHLATSITERMISMAYPTIFSTERIGKSAIVSCVADEYHEIGGRMVADILEMNGWDAIFLGTSTPLNDLMDMIEEKNPDVVALSLTIYFNIDSLKRALDLIQERRPGQKVIIGGQAFRWGGEDLADDYENVMFIPTLDRLEEVVSGGGIDS